VTTEVLALDFATSMSSAVEWSVLFLMVGLLSWTWVVYTALMASRARRNGGAAPRRAIDTTVSVVIATREDPAMVRARVQNILELPDRTRVDDIVVAVDQGAAWPLDAYTEVLAGVAHVVEGDPARGKAAGLNAGVRACVHDVFVLADSQQRFVNGSIDALMVAFAEPGVGAVSGTVRIESGDPALDAYWRTDTLVRRGQSAAHSVVTTTGQISAFRRATYPVLPDGLICDDLFATTAVIMQGHRVTFAPDAIALDFRTFSRAQNLQRKIRTLSGLVQVCQLQPAILNPFANPIWMHFMSQKILRLLTPLLAMAAGWCMISLGLQHFWPAVWSPVSARLVSLIAFAPLLTVGLSVDTASALLGPTAFLWIPMVALYNGIRRDYNVWQRHPSPGHTAASLREKRS